MAAFKKFLRGFIDILAAVVLLIALMSSYLSHGLFNAEYSGKTVCTEKFYEVLDSEIVEGLESFGDVLDISSADVVNAVGKENIRTYAYQYTVEFFEAIKNGTNFKPSEFNDGNLKEYVYNYIRGLEPSVSEEDLQELYEIIHNSVENSVKYIPGIVQQVVPHASKLFSSIAFFADIEILLYLLFVVLVAINIVLSDKNRYLDTLYGLLGTLFCVIATVAIPLLMITIYDVPSKLVIEESLLLRLISGVNSLLIINTTIIFGIAFIIIAVALITLSVFLSIKKSKEKSKKIVDKTA